MDKLHKVRTVGNCRCSFSFSSYGSILVI